MVVCVCVAKDGWMHDDDDENDDDDDDNDDDKIFGS